VLPPHTSRSAFFIGILTSAIGLPEAQVLGFTWHTISPLQVLNPPLDFRRDLTVSSRNDHCSGPAVPNATSMFPVWKFQMTWYDFPKDRMMQSFAKRFLLNRACQRAKDSIGWTGDGKMSVKYRQCLSLSFGSLNFGLAENNGQSMASLKSSLDIERDQFSGKTGFAS
jgi:hypothetical protein